MYRFLWLALLAVNVSAENLSTKSQLDGIASGGGTLETRDSMTGLDSNEPAYSDLEYEIVTLSGLLSLSEQVKSSAQHMISLAAEDANALQSSEEKIQPEQGAEQKPLLTINHAQHFGIAQSLAKSWSPVEWEKRLLVIVDSIDEETQVLIKKDLSNQTLRSARGKEKAAIEKQDKAEYQLYMNKLQQRPPAASRWKLVEALDEQSGFSQLIIQIRSKVYKEISQQVKDWQPPIDWQKAARQEVLEFLFYAYRKTPNGELKKIANSYNSPALKELLKQVSIGL